MNRFLLLPLMLVLPFSLFSQNAMKPQYGTDVAGVLALPTGKNADLYKMGFGAQAGMFYDFEESLRFSVMLGFTHMSLDGDALRRKVENAGKGTADITGGVNGFPLIVSLRLLTPGPSMRFYGAIEGGLYLYSAKMSGIYTQAGGTRINVEESEFRSEPGFNLALGVLSPLSDNLYLDVNARYHFISDSQYFSGGPWGSTVNVSTSQYFSIAVGVSYSYDLL